MKKLIALLLAMLMVVGLFAGCAGEPAASTPVETDPVETDPVETDPVETEPAKEPVTLSWWLFEDETTAPYFKAFFEDVETKFPHITLEITWLPWDTGPEKMTVAYATESYPDIIGDTYGRLAPAVDAGLTISLEPAIEKIPGITLGTEGIVDGEHHYIWQGASGGYAIACNLDLAAELGIEEYLPEDGLTWSYDDFLACLRAAKDAGYYGIDLYAGSQSSDMWYYGWLFGAGAEIMDPATGTLLANKDEYREASLKVLNLLKTIVDEGLCQPGAATMIDVDSQAIWYTGKMLFCHCAFSNTTHYAQAFVDGTSVVENFEMFAQPTPDGVQGGGDCGGFSSSGVIAFDTADGAKLDAIYDVIAYFYSEESGFFQDLMDLAPTGIPFLDWVVVDESKLSELQIKVNLNRGNPYSAEHVRNEWGPAYGWYADFRGTWYPQLSAFYAGDITAEEMLANWETTANAAVANYLANLEAAE